jgi:uncharacterized protein (TIGR04141 family)
MPSWLSLFDGALGGTPADIHNASSAAVFLVRTSGRTFALTFGYGRSVLRPGTWEEDFGLRVTLNAVDHLRVRSVDRVKFDAISQHSQIQASRDANILEFGLDVEQDLLRAVTGKPKDRTLASQLTGKDALKADLTIGLAGIPGFLDRLWVVFNQDNYKEHFGWVDHVGELRDPMQVQKLDEALIRKLVNEDFDRLWLGIPDRVEWDGIAGFKYSQSRNATLYYDIHFKTFLEEAGENFVATLDNLKNRRRISLYKYENDLPVTSWALYRCIYCEIDLDGQTFLLNNGKWYRIRSDFLQTVNDSFAAALNPGLTLPDYAHKDEATYNASVAAGAPLLYALMDQNFLKYPTSRDQIEFCDLYSRTKEIIHVKRYRGSATLSHLFSQGVVSAELFCAISKFRHELNNRLPPDFRLANPDDRPGNEEFEVVFAIVSESQSPLKLPFFSRVNLRNAVQRLSAFGYKASIVKIQAAKRASV